MTKNIFILDDHPIIIAGLTAMLGVGTEFSITGSAVSPDEARGYLLENQIDVLLLDMNLAGVDIEKYCKKLITEFPRIKIVAMSISADNSRTSKLFRSGAAGYFSKNSSPEEIMTAITTVLDGKTYFPDHAGNNQKEQKVPATNGFANVTKREKEILELIAEGLTTSQIAGKLFISNLTVESHRKNLLTKLNASNTASLIRLAVTQHII